MKDDELSKLLATRRWCYVIPREGFVEGRGYRVSIAIEYESGHYPTGNLELISSDAATREAAFRAGGKIPWFWGMTYEEATEHCAYMNMRNLGHDEKTTMDILLTTLRGEGRRSG